MRHKKQTNTNGFNKEHVQGVKKDDFVNSHKHLEKIVDLDAVWKVFNPVKK